MADESFILTLVGQLDEDGTRKNVESILGKINKSINESNINKIKIFDKDDLDKQGSVYITGLENIREQILELLKLDENTGVSIAKIFDDNGAIAKFKVSLEDAIGVLKEYNFERAKFSDGSVGAVMTSGTGINPTFQIAGGYETINQNVQKATGSVKVFTQESENNLNRLSSKIIQTSTNLTFIDEESKKAIRSIQNVLKGASEITIGTGDNAQTIRGFDSIESFLARYQKFAEGFKGNPVLNLNVDDNGTLQGFTARIETTQGAVQNLVFRLRQLEEEEETFFQYQGANVNDSTFDVQVEAITKLEQKYENFKSKLQDGASFKFIDTTDTLNKLKVIEDVIKGLKNNVGLNHIIDIENLEKALGLIIETANETEKVEKKKQSETDKTTTKINRQNKQLETTRVLLESWEKTKINPDSASFIGNSDKLQGVKDKLEEVMKLRKELAEDNDGNLIISDDRMNKLTVGLSELRLLMSEAKKESGKSLERNESYEKLAQDIEITNSKLDAQISKWKNMGVYYDKLKDDAERLQKTLNAKDSKTDRYTLGSSKELDTLKAQLQILDNNALQAKRDLKGVVAPPTSDLNEFNQKIELSNSRLDVYIQRWKNMGVYTGEIKRQGDTLKDALGKDLDGNNLVKSKEELKQINNQMRILNSEAQKVKLQTSGSEAKTLESQKKWIDLATESLKQYKKEVTDVDSLNPLQGENLTKAANAIDFVEAKLTALKNRNNKGDIIEDKWINSYILELKKLENEIENYYNEQTKLEAIQETGNKVDLYREKLTTLEQKYSEIISKSEEFRKSFDSVKNGLNGIKTPEELKAWEQEFKKMQEAAKRTGASLKNDIRTDELSQKVALLRQQINAFEQSNPRAANIYATVFERLKEELNQVANNGDFKRIQNEFRSLKITIDQAGVSGKTFGQRMQEAFKRMSSYLGVTSMMMYTVRAIREIINNVKELDTQMVRLRRVTDETDTTYKNMFNNAVKSAKELNTSVSNIIESTANLSKMNFDPATAARLADLVNMFDKVAEINNVEESTNSLVSIINGFTDLEADDAERIIDVMDNLGNKFAVSARDLSEILKRSSASLSEANNSIEESVAMGTVAQTIAQDSSKVGKIYADYKFYSKR